jgi:hypothetical protein
MYRKNDGTNLGKARILLEWSHSETSLHIAFEYPRILIRALPFSDDFHYTFFWGGTFPATGLAQKIYTVKVSFKYPVFK